MKVSNTADGPADYQEGNDWRHNPDLFRGMIDWSPPGAEPAPGSKYFVTLTSAIESTLAKFQFTGGSVLLDRAPAVNEAIFVDYVYGKHEPDASAALMAHLKKRHAAGSLDDCPLPEVFRQTKASHPGLTLGQFHDLLRRLYENRQIYLHPWTGPLYELPEPACALLAGHEVVYYASVRS